MGILDTVNARLAIKKQVQVIANISPLEAIETVLKYGTKGHSGRKPKGTAAATPATPAPTELSTAMSKLEKSKHLVATTPPDETAKTDSGVLARHGHVLVHHYDDGSKEHWTTPSVDSAKENFKSMAERWKPAGQEALAAPAAPAAATSAATGNAGYSEENLKKYLDGLHAKNAEYQKKMGGHNAYKSHYHVEHGNRYAKVVVTNANIETGEPNPNGSRSVHSFIDKTNGNVLKANSWKAPHPAPRGNIGNEDHGMKNMTPHGPAYLK